MAATPENPFDRVDRIIAAHRVYMEMLGHVEWPRLYHGLNFSSFQALRFVASRGRPPPVTLIAERCRMHRSHASHLLHTLESQGFVAGSRDFSDRRCRMYEATPKGISLARAFDEQLDRRLSGIVLNWSLDKQAEVTRLMEGLARSLRNP